MRTIAGWAVAGSILVACGSDATTNGTSTSSSSSSSGDTNCSDCGRCGIAGPVNETAMRAQTYGVDASGRAAVTLNLAMAGECEGENQHATTLHVLATNDDFEITPGFEMLDRTKAKPDTSQGGVTSYVWNDRDLSVKVDNEGAAGLTLAFSTGGATVLTVKCLPTGATGACTKQ